MDGEAGEGLEAANRARRPPAGLGEDVRDDGDCSEPWASRQLRVDEDGEEDEAVLVVLFYSPGNHGSSGES